MNELVLREPMYNPERKVAKQEKSKIKRAGIYTRVSHRPHNRKTRLGLIEGEASLDTQSNALKKHAEAMGWLVVKEYRDVYLSGGTIEERKGFQQMLKDAEEGKIDIVLFYKYDRFARNTRDVLNTVEFLKEHNVDFVSLHDNVDTSSPQGYLFLTMIAGFAELERKETSRRTIQVMEGIAYNHKTPLAPVPYGYVWVRNPDGITSHVEIEPEKAAIVKQIFKDYIELKSISKVHKKHPQFARSKIAYILANPFYIGLFRWRKQLFESKVPAIIDRKTWNEVMKIREKNVKFYCPHQAKG